MARAVALALLAASAMVMLGAGPAAAAPELRVTPGSGPPGTEITVAGTGFPAGDIQIHWGSQDGPHLASATGPDFTVTAVVPEAPPNSHQVHAVTRSGNAVSTSSAPFQVTGGEIVTTTTATTTPTTVAEPVTTTTVAPTRSTTAPAGADRQASGVGGGAEDMADTVGNTVTGGQPASAAGASPGVTSTTPATGAAVGAGAGAAAAGAGGSEPVPTTGSAVGPGAAGSPLSGGSPVDAPPGAPPDRAGEAALGQKASSQSSGAVSNPVLLAVGLAMVFFGGAFLAIRNRQRPPS